MRYSIQVYVYDRQTKTGRWVFHRHKDGTKEIAKFSTLGALRRFVKHHCLNVGQRCRTYDSESGITNELA